eukprot:6727753-Heterocapsa_arctica.AAC.1
MDSLRSSVLSAVRRALSLSASCANSFSNLAYLSASDSSGGTIWAIPTPVAASPFRRSLRSSSSLLLA